MRKKGPFASIGDILGKWTKSRKWDSKLRQYSLFSQWPEIVGTKIAQHAQPRIWRGDVLVVAVDHPTWMAELRMQESEILEKIRRASPEVAVKKIHWEAGG